MIEKIKINKKNIKNDISFYKEYYVIDFLHDQPGPQKKVIDENIYINNIPISKTVKSINFRTISKKLKNKKHKNCSSNFGVNEISLIDLILNNKKNKVLLSAFI